MAKLFAEHPFNKSVEEPSLSLSKQQPAASEAKGSNRLCLHRPTALLLKEEKALFGELMASKLVQLQSKASQASQFVAKHGTSYYKQLLEQNKQFIQEPATVEKCNELSKKFLYTRLASIPGRYEAMWKEIDYVKHLWKHKQDLKVEEAGVAVVFGLECFAWFCAGEIIGRGFTFTGYYP